MMREGHGSSGLMKRGKSVRSGELSAFTNNRAIVISVVLSKHVVEVGG